MNDTGKKRFTWLLHKNVLFVIIAVAAFLLWPSSQIREQPQPLPRADVGALICHENFETDVLANKQSGWSRLWTNNTQLVRIADGMLRIDFGSDKPAGAVYVLKNYVPRRIYEIHLKLRQVKTSGAIIVRVRQSDNVTTHQIAGRRLLPTETDGFADVSMEFVAPTRTGQTVLIQFYPYEAAKDRGGEMMIDQMDILQW